MASRRRPQPASRGAYGRSSAFSRCLAFSIALEHSSIFSSISSSSPLRLRSREKNSYPWPTAISPSRNIRSAKTCVARNPVPKRPVVSVDPKSLLEPPDNSAASSWEENGAPSCSKIVRPFSSLRSTVTTSLPALGPASSAFCRSSNGHLTPARCGASRASRTLL